VIEAYRTIRIPIELQDGLEREIEVPFTVVLLLRVEETLQKASSGTWFRLRKSDQSIIEAFEDFCRPYFSADFDFSQVQPTFCALFFSNVRKELLRSIDDCMTSMKSTVEPGEPTEEKTRTDGQ
jgi:hypothetical protein